MSICHPSVEDWLNKMCASIQKGFNAEERNENRGRGREMEREGMRYGGREEREKGERKDALKVLIQTDSQMQGAEQSATLWAKAVNNKNL